MKTCMQCPNRITDQKQIRTLVKRPVGAPVCSAFGHVLESNEQSEDDKKEAAFAFAQNCDKFGEEVPVQLIAKPTMRVAEPDPEILANAHPEPVPVQTCHGCIHLIQHNVIYDRFGWPLTLCRAKGKLVVDGFQEAKGCPWALPGTNSTDASSVVLRPELRPGFVADPDREFNELVKRGFGVDPRTYETDKEVTEEDYANGIRAWRNLEDPFGSKQIIPLPIFRNDFFTEEEQLMIPAAGSARHPELYVDYSNLTWRFAVEGWTLGNTLFIQSEPGLGKTDFVYYLGWLMQLPVTRLFFTDKIEWDDIYGKLVLQTGNMIWQDGRYTAAIRRPGLVIVDEPNMALPEVVATLRTTAEQERSLFLDAGISVKEDGTIDRLKLIVPLHKFAFPIWCANPSWDPRNIGTKQLAAADISRLSPAVVEPPPPSIERRIIKTHCKSVDGWDIPDDLVRDLLKVSEDIRTMSKDGEFPGTWGIRENVKVARKLRYYPFEEAFRMAALNHFEPEVRAMVIESSIKTIRKSSAFTVVDDDPLHF